MSARSTFAICLCLGVSLPACKSTEAEPAAPASSAPAASPLEPVKFSAVTPADFAPVTLRGEGSEVLSAPVGTRVTPSGAGFDLRGEPDFALHLRPRPPDPSQIEASLVEARRVFRAGELSVFQSNSGGYGFVQIRELVPEWDESDRRRIGCISAGIRLDGSPTPPEALRFSKSAVEKMMGACNTLALPALE